MEDEPRIAAWDAKVDWPLTGLTLVFLAGYAWQVLDTSLGQAAREALDLVLTGIWVLLGLDYLVRLGLAVSRGLLLDLVATGDEAGVDAAAGRFVDLLRRA